MRTTRRVLATAAVALLALTACGDGDDATDAASGDEETAAPTDEPPTDEAPSEGAGETPSAGQELPTSEPPADSRSEGPSGGAAPDDAHVDEAIANLARNSDADPDDIEVVSYEEVTWSDGSIGCPEPGRAYTQALVEGMRLVLTLDGEEYHYHAADDGSLSYCADPVEPAETGDAVR